MLRTITAAFVAATLLAAPAFAEGTAGSAPAPRARIAASVPHVRAGAPVKTAKHLRKHRHVARHTGHVRHAKAGVHGKFAHQLKTNKRTVVHRVASAKPVTRAAN